MYDLKNLIGQLQPDQNQLFVSFNFCMNNIIQNFKEIFDIQQILVDSDAFLGLRKIKAAPRKNWSAEIKTEFPPL